MSKDRKERKANVIEVLNKARSMELYAVHQYMNQHYSLDGLDYGELAANMKLIAIDEMKHAEAFAERIKELGGEKLDIVEYSELPETYIANALAPAQVLSVTMLEDSKTCRVIVPDSQLSLAIGREGQNARLAAKLTGYKIDIKSESNLGQ